MGHFQKLRDDIDGHSQRYLWASIVVFVLFFTILVLKKYYYFGYNIADLAIFNQTFFNTLHGRWFEETITLNNYFADHFSPILFFLIPFYAIKPSAVTLLVMQVVITALCAWPIFAIAKKQSGHNLFAYIIALLWLANPFVHRQTMYEFHLYGFMIFLFFWAFYFYQENKIKYFILFFILTLFTREDTIFLFFGLSLLALVEKRSKKTIINIILWSLVYFFIAIFVIRLSSPSSSYKFLEYYSWLGGDSFVSIIATWLKHPLDVLAHIFTIKNIFIVGYFFLPFLFIPFFAKKYLLLSFFPFLQFFMMSKGLGAAHIYTHYSMILLPGVYIAYIAGLWAILSKKIGKNFLWMYNHKLFFVSLFIFSFLFFPLFVSPLVKIISKDYIVNQHTNRKKIIDAIPADASVCTDPSLMPALSLRRELYNIDYVYYGKSAFAERDFILPRVDYILFDMSQFLITISDRNAGYLWRRADPLHMPDQWLKTLGDYSLISVRDNIFLWQNNDIAKKESLPFFDLIPIDFDNNNFIKDWSVENGELDSKTLKITYNNINSNNYLVRFYQGAEYWDLPFDYGLYSLDQKNSGKAPVVYYYINNTVDSFEIYHYESKKTLGDLNNIEPSIKGSVVFPRQKIKQ